MQVVLIDDVFELGRRGDVVRVSPGYGRNYLVPRRLAVPATPANLKMVEQLRIAAAKKEATFREAAEILARELGLLHVLVSRKAGDTGVLFGSVTSKDLGEVLAGAGINLDRRRILLEHPIKNIGNYTVEIRPHTDVEAQILVSVLPEGDREVARAIPRGVESDGILEELNAKVADLQRVTGTDLPGQTAP